MKVVFGLFFVFVCAVANAKPADDHYTTKYDNVDIEPIIKNDRLLRGYVDCLLGIKHCNKDGEELKSKFILFNFSKYKYIKFDGKNEIIAFNYIIKYS